MRSAFKLACLLLPCCIALSAQAQSVYRWVDKDGKVHYGDSPPPENKTVQQKNLKAGQAVATEDMPFAVKEAMRKSPVTAYLTNCGPLCDGARTFLAKRGVPYTVKDPENNPADAESLTKLVGGLEVPLLQVGDRSVKGFTEESWGSALDSAGYPRVNPFTKSPEPKKSEMPKDRKFEDPAAKTPPAAPTTTPGPPPKTPPEPKSTPNTK
jgi:hypothetical protein